MEEAGDAGHNFFITQIYRCKSFRVLFIQVVSITTYCNQLAA